MDTQPAYPRPERRSLKALATCPRLGANDNLRPASMEALFALGRSLAQFNLLHLPVLNVRTNALIDGGRLVDTLRAQGGPDEVWVWLVDLPEQQEAAAHMVLQNHAGGWNWELVAAQLKALERSGLPLHLSGFGEDHTGPLLAANWKPGAVGDSVTDHPQQASLL